MYFRQDKRYLSEILSEILLRWSRTDFRKERRRLRDRAERNGIGKLGTVKVIPRPLSRVDARAHLRCC